MPSQPGQRKRTAVLVVHGMGSQRPFDTVRGVVDAVWLEGDHSAQGPRRTWTHPQLSGTDIDLPVITTNFVPDADRRRIDFHELYWAHLMSETRAVAVLLWLFELARKGPRLRPGMGALWWCAAVFLCLLNLSLALLSLQTIAWFSGTQGEPQSMLVAPVLMGLIALLCGLCVALGHKAFRLAKWLGIYALLLCLVAGVVGAIAFGLFRWLGLPFKESLQLLTNVLLPLGVALLATWFLMGPWGLLAFGLTFLLSLAFGAVYLIAVALDFLTQHETIAEVLRNGWLPWSIASEWSAVAAWVIIGIYLILNAGFLQSYLGDAARYFRNAPANVAVRREIRKQAVDTLESLHLSGIYDRIVVVAHSLGTVVAYDMLRAYYSRVHKNLPDPSVLGPDRVLVDEQNPARQEARAKGRAVIAEVAQVVETARQRIKVAAPQPGDRDLRAWLVTDFVTMGSPLTHAHYLMCNGRTANELAADFERRVREREFPTSPPRNLDGDGRLTYENPNDHLRYFHHGGQFALTRWTNLYFPLFQLVWGDAIGGPVAPIFGDGVVDVPVYESKSRRDSFFAHVLYWVIPVGEGSKAPHIVALQNAIDPADTGIVNGLQSATD